MTAEQVLEAMCAQQQTLNRLMDHIAAQTPTATEAATGVLAVGPSSPAVASLCGLDLCTFSLRCVVHRALGPGGAAVSNSFVLSHPSCDQAAAEPLDRPQVCRLLSTLALTLVHYVARTTTGRPVRDSGVQQNDRTVLRLLFCRPC